MKTKLRGLLACIALLEMLAVSIIWTASTNAGNTATIVQASVFTDLQSQAFNFEIIWSSPPDLYTVDSGGRPADQFQYKIANPTVANSCCGAFNNPEGFFSFNSDYIMTESLGTISLGQGNFGNPGSLVGTIPFNLSGSVLDFTIPFSVLNEPNGFIYILDSFRFGASGSTILVGDNNGFAGPNYFSTPLPNSLSLMASSLVLAGIIGVLLRRKILAQT
jgi:hypothetical protein